MNARHPIIRILTLLAGFGLRIARQAALTLLHGASARASTSPSSARSEHPLLSQKTDLPAPNVATFWAYVRLRAQRVIALRDNVVRNPVEFVWIQLSNLLILNVERFIDVLLDHIVVVVVFVDNPK